MSTDNFRMRLNGSGPRKGLVLKKQWISNSQDSLDSQRWREHKYDEQTGQIYTERTARILSSQDRAWSRRTWVVYDRNDAKESEQFEAAKIWEARRLGRSVKSPSASSENTGLERRKGSRTLQSTALEQVIQNISELTPDAFEYLPITLVKRIWDVARKRCVIAFDTWALFSKILYNEDYISEDLLQYAEAFSLPQLPLEMYTQPVTSTSFDFITSLCITTPFALPDLVKLDRIRNLGILEIINTSISSAGYARMGVSDRLVRSWHEAAIRKGAFPVLRVLRLWNHEDLTVQSLIYLNGFPSLAVYDVQGCNMGKHARSSASDLGWKANPETDVLKALELTCKRRTEILCKQIIGPPEVAGLFATVDDIRRLPEDQVNAFLTAWSQRTSQAAPPDHLNSQLNSTPVLRLNPEPGFPRRAQTKATRIVYRQDEYFLQQSQKLDAWEVNACKMYARIGELRSETDLKRAGIPIKEVVVKGDELINPIPMVLVRLGKSVTSLVVKTGASIHPQAFIRIQAPSEEWVHSDSSKALEGPSSQASENLAVRSMQSQPGPVVALSIKTAQPSLQKNKKRRLDDVLGTFL